MRERDEAKAERDAQRKEAVSNIANIFTGSKTKRLEAEVARKDNEIRELKDRAEAREQDFRREMSNLSDSLRRQKESEASTIRIHNYLETDLNTFFPDVLPLLEAARECRDVGLSDTVTSELLDQRRHISRREQPSIRKHTVKISMYPMQRCKSSAAPLTTNFTSTSTAPVCSNGSKSNGRS